MKKQSINGKQISKKEAYKGLGYPKTWDKYKKEVMAEFTKKPKK